MALVLIALSITLIIIGTILYHFLKINNFISEFFLISGAIMFFVSAFVGAILAIAYTPEEVFDRKIMVYERENLKIEALMKSVNDEEILSELMQEIIDNNSIITYIQQEKANQMIVNWWFNFKTED